MRFIFFSIFVALMAVNLQAAISLKQFYAKPKLVVVIVVDQFRADYLTRFANDFIPNGGGSKIGGYRYLMEKGAYFPFARYNVFQAMTCPGHSMVLTGATPSETGIPLNEWYDRDKGELTYCVKDDEFGVSPRRLKTTTVPDEWKNADRKGKVISLALKDRAAIMLGGHRPDNVIWMNEDKLQWETSGFYNALPKWTVGINENLQNLRNKKYLWKNLKQEIPYSDFKALSSPFGIETTLDLALAALENEKLGQVSGQTDFLLISLSAHDYAGHSFGPNSPEMKDMTLFEDQQLARLFAAIDKKVGMKSSLIALTGDHGIPPTVEYTKANKIKSDRLDHLALFKKIYSKLDETFGAPKKGPWIIATKYLNYYLNQAVLAEKRLDASMVSATVKDVLLKEEGVAAVYTQSELLNSKGVPGYWHEALVNQFVFDVSGDIIIMPQPFYYESSKVAVTHMTGYNYDTRVPLVIVGEPMKPGVYAEPVLVADLAPTLSFILNIVPPPKARGRVLFEALGK